MAGGNAFAGGAYQWTDDRKKALVWNNDPQPGDTASWSGEHDENDYASGPGTLSWFRVNQGFTTGSNIAVAKKRIPISTYSGTMVRGKFRGGVMTVDHGKAYHANFVDGRRKGQWSTGPLITKAESAEPAPAKQKPEAAKAATSTESPGESAKISSLKVAVPAQDEPDIPAEGPAPADAEKTQPPGTKLETSESAQPLIAQASSESPDESETPRTPVTRKAALAPGAVRAIERPTESTTKKSEPPRPKSERTEKATKVAKAAASQPPKSAVSQTEQGTPEGTAAQNKAEDVGVPKLKSEQLAAEAAKPSAKESPVDDSIESLVGPPASLRASNPAETSSPAQVGTPAAQAATGPPVAGATKLTAVNAMDIADIEARTRGYDLGEYELPKAEYSAASDTWLVSYVPRDANAKTKKLSVTIQDKNGKAEIKK